MAGFFSSFGCEGGCCTATWSVISFVRCYSFSVIFFADFEKFSYNFLGFGFSIRWNTVGCGRGSVVICMSTRRADNRRMRTDEMQELRRRALTCPAGRVRDNGSGAL